MSREALIRLFISNSDKGGVILNKEKILHLSSLVFIACSCVLLIGAMITGVILTPSQYSYYENRNLSSSPEITVEGIMDGSFFTDLETYIKERSAVRETFLRLSTFIDLYILLDLNH